MILIRYQFYRLLLFVVVILLWGAKLLDTEKWIEDQREFSYLFNCEFDNWKADV